MYWLYLYICSSIQCTGYTYIYVQVNNVLVILIYMFKYTMYWLDLYICSSIQCTG